MNKAPTINGRKSAGPLIGSLLVVSALVFTSRAIHPSASDNDRRLASLRARSRRRALLPACLD